MKFTGRLAGDRGTNNDILYAFVGQVIDHLGRHLVVLVVSAHRVSQIRTDDFLVCNRHINAVVCATVVLLNPKGHGGAGHLL